MCITLWILSDVLFTTARGHGPTYNAVRLLPCSSLSLSEIIIALSTRAVVVRESQVSRAVSAVASAQIPCLRFVGGLFRKHANSSKAS